MRVSLRRTLAGALAALALPALAQAQYFGRNKVQYDSFDFQVLRTEHFDVHFYPQEAAAARDGARMAERWYARLADAMGHEILSRQTLVLYADHADFQQTNVVSGELDESTGGVTESLQRRVVLPLAQSYHESDHVIGHELVHAFQYDIANRGRGGIAAMNQVPLWMIEGMAEYLSVGRRDAHTAMWLRDAVLHDDVPTLKKLGRDSRYFPYRFGQAVWAYIGGTYGDRQVTELFRAALRGGSEHAIERVLGIRQDTLSARWIESVKATYQPLIAGRTRPDSIGRGLEAAKPGPYEMMLAPSISPDGRFIAFVWARDVSLDLYLADAGTGKVVRRLASGTADGRYDALSFMGSAGAWSPDGSRFAFVVFSKGDNEIAVLDVASGKVQRRYAVDGVGAIATPAWSPDGRTLAFSGSSGGQTDLYLLDLESAATRRLTRDAFADLQPAWSPDGRTLAFVTDRGAAFSLDSLTYETPHIALIDVSLGSVRDLPLPFGGHRTNPQFAPSGDTLFFLADPDGFRDLYRIALTSGEVRRVTRLATGITGLGALSPAMTIAARTGDAAFTVFDRRGYALRWLRGHELGGEAAQLVAHEGFPVGGTLPPVAHSRVQEYLADAPGGLPDTSTFQAHDYRATPKLSYVGAPSFGVGSDAFGTGVYANLQAYFQDVLGDHGLMVQLIANGGFGELGGSVYYENMARRLNWGVGVGRTPYVLRYQAAYDTTVTQNGQPSSGYALVEYRERYIMDEGFLGARYPLSATRRLEASTGLTRLSYDFELELVTQNLTGNTIGRETIDLPAPDAITVWQTSLALVSDNSIFGIASPVQGGRWRLAVEPTAGSFNFYSVTADWRRYLYSRPLTLALRGLHYGRYGRDADRLELGSYYLGNGSLVRGYSYESWSSADCSGAESCPEFYQLLGSRVAVANAELRLPLLGNERYGLLNFRFLPTEVGAFVDGGIAWSGSESDALEREPVFSAGLTARVNILGAFVLEAYYAHPFQRSTGNRFGLQLTPGW